MEIDYDFDGSLKLTEVVEDFFYSPSTKMYIFRHPLIVDERVLKTADGLGIKVQASPEKWLINTELSDALKILKKLESTSMSLPEYFKIRKDTIKAKDKEMLQSLESDQFIEYLATVFLHDKWMIHHPRIKNDNFSGNKIRVNIPKGRYGWIYPNNIDLKTGLPTKVKYTRKIEDETIKYWDTHTDIGKKGTLMAVRGFVTSIGKISLDLGFPADAVSQKLTIRECKKSRPEGVLEEEILSEAKKILTKYYDAVKDKTVYKEIPEWCDNFLSFIKKHKDSLQAANDVASQVLKEDIRDALGIIWTYSLLNSEKESAEKIKFTAQYFSGLEKITDDSFANFIKDRKDKLTEAIKNHKSIVFVLGHNNPDTDTVVSAIAEAYRQQLINKETLFMPVVPGSKLPQEIKELIGKELSEHLILTEEELYKKASKTGRPEWVMVDHNIGPEQPDTRAIIDHHYPSEVSLRQQIPRKIIFAGSTTALIAQRLYGLGIDIPKDMARILHGATLMDTENRFPGKMTPLDDLIMDRLQKASGIKDESKLYQQLMQKLISCYNPEELFLRDYKEDWNFFGFAVAKGIKILDKDKVSLVEKLQELAKENNKAKNFPLTLVKVVDYDEDAETIRKERMYTVFQDNASQKFEDAVKQAIITVIKHESPKNVKTSEAKDSIDYWGVGTQLSRKKLAPVLDFVVNAFNQYFYSPSTKLYFKRDFLRKNKNLERIAKEHNLKLHTNKEGVVVGNPAELKFYLQKLGFTSATPSEYFKAYFDALKINDTKMVSHLTSSKYLEVLNAIVENKQVLIEHPEILLKDDKFSYKAKSRKTVYIPKGVPGLINPEKIGEATGLPLEVEDPQQYGKGLWRYWSPDSDCSWVLRSTIFTYDIPALDLKFDFYEALPRLSIRPCVKTVKDPDIKVYEKSGKIVVKIKD